MRRTYLLLWTQSEYDLLIRSYISCFFYPKRYDDFIIIIIINIITITTTIAIVGGRELLCDAALLWAVTGKLRKQKTLKPWCIVLNQLIINEL